MTLLHDILKWTETLPDWQRDATRRLLQKEEGLADADYDELYILLKAAHGLPNEDALSSIPLAANHLPTKIQKDEKIVLKTMRQLQNVNLLSPDEVLTFAESGLTIIYGGNGSGKSGYGRVLKQACRARDQADKVLPDANDPAATFSVPSATFDLNVSGIDCSVTWVGDQDSPEKLSTISVFDSGCARAYLTTEQDVAYLPYGLDIVEKLANEVLPKLSERLDAEIESISIDMSPFNYLSVDTMVGKKIQELSTKTKASDIEALGEFGEIEEKRLVDLESALSVADPIAKAAELDLSVARLKQLADDINRPLTWVNSDAVKKLKKLDQESLEASTAEEGAALALQSNDDLLEGTGGVVWKALFEAARKFSNEVTNSVCDFSHIEEGSLCPLCQEPLPTSASARIVRFEQYIQDDVAKVAEDSRQKLDVARRKIENSNLSIGMSGPIVEELRLLDDSVPPAIEEFETSVSFVKTSMLAALDSHDWSTVGQLTQNPRTKVRAMAARQLREARTLLRAADEEKKKALVVERAELLAKQSLSRSLKPVLDLLKRMKQREALEKCKTDLKTLTISKKSKELASSAVTVGLNKALNAEFKALGIGHIRTKLKERNQKGRMYHQLVLDLPTSHDLHKILSEGEQRAIAIGSFMAELRLANHSCGVVFDDPVSSLDHNRRGKVARRLMEESKSRQVIVFTHDVVFLSQLREEGSKNAVNVEVAYLDWEGSHPGIVTNGLPWQHKSVEARIDVLEKVQKSFEKLPWPENPSEELAGKITRQYSFLRATIERAVQDKLLNGTVRRFHDYIQVTRIRGVVGLLQSEVDELCRLNQRCHDVVEAHDPSSAKDDPPPCPDELGKDIADLKSLLSSIKARKKPKS